MDPLAQLQDIQLPEKIHSYPIAIGWWLLACICIGLILFITIKVMNSKKHRHSQQQALLQLASSDATTEHCVASLKWAALQYFPRENIANLYGDNFHQFLISALPNKHQEKFTILSSDTLQNMYQKNDNSNNNDNFYQASLFWLKHALPPKTELKLKPESESENAVSNNLSESK